MKMKEKKREVADEDILAYEVEKEKDKAGRKMKNNEEGCKWDDRKRKRSKI